MYKKINNINNDDKIKDCTNINKQQVCRYNNEHEHDECQRM